LILALIFSLMLFVLEGKTAPLPNELLLFNRDSASSVVMPSEDLLTILPPE
jgi:hypothetical protein